MNNEEIAERLWKRLSGDDFAEIALRAVLEELSDEELEELLQQYDQETLEEEEEEDEEK